MRLFVKKFNLIDTKYQQVTNDSNWDLIDLTYTAQEECQVSAYISMEDGSLSDFYIDDVTITHTPTKVIQYNEYYPFGMQTDRSWTRGTATGNNFLSNGGTELNPASQLYDLGFRNLDPVLGRFHQVDPMADKYGSQNPYHYASNNPANLNDVSGLDPEGAWGGSWLFKVNQARSLMADSFGGGGGGGADGPMNDNPDGIQNMMNSYYDNTPSSMNVFNWFQPTTEQLVNSAFNRTPAGTNAFYSGNGTLLQSGYSGSITLQGGGPVIYNEYVNDYVPAYLITMNGGVNTNKELYERALKAIADWGAPDSFDASQGSIPGPWDLLSEKSFNFQNAGSNWRASRTTGVYFIVRDGETGITYANFFTLEVGTPKKSKDGVVYTKQDAVDNSAMVPNSVATETAFVSTFIGPGGRAMTLNEATLPYYFASQMQIKLNNYIPGSTVTANNYGYNITSTPAVYVNFFTGLLERLH